MRFQYLSVFYVLVEFLSNFWVLNLHGSFIKTWQCLVDNLLYQFLFDTFQWCHSSIHSFIYWFGDLSSSSSLQSHTKCSFSIYNWSNLEKNKISSSFSFSIHTSSTQTFARFYPWCERCTWIWQRHVNLIKLNKWRTTMTMTMNE